MPELSDEELDALVGEATVDACGDVEQLGGFAAMIEDNLEVPFDTTVLGVAVTVQKVTQADSAIVADCVRDGPGICLETALAAFVQLRAAAIRRTPAGSFDPIRRV